MGPTTMTSRVISVHRCLRNTRGGNAMRLLVANSSTNFFRASSCQVGIENPTFGGKVGGISSSSRPISAIASYSCSSQLGCSCAFPNVISSRQSRYMSSAATEDSSDDANTIPFLLADIGEGIKEVELLQWFVQEGDVVKQFDRICEVQSDKATVEITSRYDGIIDHLAGTKVGDMVQVGEPLLYIRVEGADADTASDSQAPKGSNNNKLAMASVMHNMDSTDQQLHIPRVASQFRLDSDVEDGGSRSDSQEVSASSSGKFLATPAVRKLGKEYKLDLSTLVGSGPQGRVLKSDVLTHLKDTGRIPEGAMELASTTTFPASAGQVQTPPTLSVQVEASVPKPYLHTDEVVKIKGYNRLMIQTMTASRDIPHMGYTDEFNLSKLVEYRKHLSPKVSILAFFVKATSLSIREHPMINASWKDIDKGEATMWAQHNIGVAMDTPRGLVVPVIKNCQDKTLVEIQQDLDSLKAIAADGKFTEEHLTGCTFSLSNIGSLGGGTYMNPLIVPPQAGIGAMGTIRTLPRFDDNGDVFAAKIMNVSWAGDHRMVDGATLARFSNLCKAYLEDPVRMLVSLR